MWINSFFEFDTACIVHQCDYRGQSVNLHAVPVRFMLFDRSQTFCLQENTFTPKEENKLQFAKNLYLKLEPMNAK